MKPHVFEFGLAATLLGADQATKLWAAARLDLPVTVVPGFLRFSLSHNRGALFGWLGDLSEPGRSLLLTALPLVAVLAIVALLLRTPAHDRVSRIGLALILGGAVGNVVDRLRHGHVVDFIDVHTSWPPLADRLVAWFGTNRWPTFNVADAGLVCGSALLLYEILRRRRGAGDAAVVSVPD